MIETTIDEISEDKNGNVILLLRQTEPWDNRETLVNFQKRLNGYIDVVTHGALYEKYPDLKGRSVRVRLLCYHEPPKDMREKLDRVNQTLAGLGIGFEIVQIKVETKPRDRLKESIVSVFKKIKGEN